MSIEKAPDRGTTRRSALKSVFQTVGGGIFGGAFVDLLSQDLYGGSRALAAETPHGGQTTSGVYDLSPKTPHFEPKARAVIHLFMNGGPSQMDLFDPKEALTRHHGKPYFGKIAGEVESPSQAGALMKSPFIFGRHGKCGMWVSEVLPHLARHVDDIALVRSLYTVNLTHEPAIYKIQSGRQLPGFPTLGAWSVYGLGSENRDLPGYVVLDDPRGLPVNGVENWQAGFLPPVYQGTRFRSEGSPVLDLRPEVEQPHGVTALERSLIRKLDQLHQTKRPGYPTLGARLSNYELAARMQLSASDALDLSAESKKTHELYGLGDKQTDSYGRRCLIARRLVERGVRFVQIYINGQIWDHHSNIESGLRSACGRTDKPIAGLLEDLKQRGLLDSTLIVWGGEFGRLPISQTGRNKVGRDHNKNAAVTWFAGAGIQPGVTYGATDELSLEAVEDRVSVQDWHATILHLMGMDHEKLFFERDGLEEKLTSVFDAQVIDGILS